MKFTNERTWNTCRQRNDAFKTLIDEIGGTGSMTELDSLIAANEYEIDRFQRGDKNDDQHDFNYYDAITEEIEKQKTYLNQKKDFTHGF